MANEIIEEVLSAETVQEEAQEELVQSQELSAEESKAVRFEVLDKTGTVTNTYSIENHGDDAEEYANNYAKKIGGTVVKYA